MEKDERDLEDRNRYETRMMSGRNKTGSRGKAVGPRAPTKIILVV